MRFSIITVSVFLFCGVCFSCNKDRSTADNSAAKHESKAEHINKKFAESGKKKPDPYLTLAKKAWKSNQYSTAIEYAKRAERNGYKNKNRDAEADAIRILGLIYYEIGYFEKSNENAFKALKIYEEKQNVKGQIQSYNNIANAFADQKNVTKATDFYQKALNLSKKSGDPVLISMALHNIGYLNFEQKKFSTARKYFEESLQINKALKDGAKVAVSFMTLGELLLAIGEDSAAFDHFRKAELIFEKSDSQIELARIYLNFSSYYDKINNFEKRSDYAQKALDLGKKMNLMTVQIPAAEQLYKINHLKNPDLANQYGLLYYKLRDSLESNQDMTKISQLEMVYGLEKAEQAEAMKKQSRQYASIFGIILFVLFVIVFVFLMYVYIERKRKKIVEEKKILEEDLEIKNKELTINVMSLMKGNALTQDLIHKLLDIKNSITNDQDRLSIEGVIRDLKKSYEKDVWKDFEMRFKEVHTSFYNELGSKFPNLSPNEVKTAAFIRLNLSSKDIAELTGKRVETIEIARYRLRKKLGITNQQTNLTTFLSQL